MTIPKIKPMPRLNLTVPERAKMIAAMDKGSKDQRLTKELRIESAQMATQLRRIQARRVN